MDRKAKCNSFYYKMTIYSCLIILLLNSNLINDKPILCHCTNGNMPHNLAGYEEKLDKWKISYWRKQNEILYKQMQKKKSSRSHSNIQQRKKSVSKLYIWRNKICN